jgi:hypothetical protein
VTNRLPPERVGQQLGKGRQDRASAQSGLDRVTWRRSTITSWRSTRISASFDAWLRHSKASQPNTRTTNKYSRRTDTSRHHALSR